MRIGHLDVAFALGKPGHVVLELDIGIDDVSQDETQAGEAAEQGDCQDDQCEYLCGAGKGREQKARLRDRSHERQPAQRENRRDPGFRSQRPRHEPGAYRAAMMIFRGIDDFDFRDFAGQIVRDDRAMCVHPQASPS